jgi:hypothetical protein
VSVFGVTHVDVDLVTAQNDGDILADANQVSVPVGNVLVCDTTGDVEHDDTTLSLDVVSIAQTAKFLLTCCVPDVEADGTEVGVELKRMNLDTESGDVLLFKFSRQMAL